jgi:hypothetical protein
MIDENKERRQSTEKSYQALKMIDDNKELGYDSVVVSSETMKKDEME